jgi:FtsZ-binding cell division protein ZapB
MRGGFKRFSRYGVILAILWFAIGISSGISHAVDRSDPLLAEIHALETTFQQVLNQLDRSARQSEEVSREVQALKSQKTAGVLHQIRLEGLLSRLREILLDRRELKKLEQTLQSEREKKVELLYDLMGEEINSLLREAEGLMQRGEGQRADQIHRSVLAKMQAREALRRPRSLHIAALPEIEVPDLEGASPAEMREMAVLLRNDAETLDKKRKEIEEERRLLLEELKIKRTLARVQGFPRGIEKKPIDRQIQLLEERLAVFDQAVERYAERVGALFTLSDVMLARSKREEDRLK